MKTNQFFVETIRNNFFSHKNNFVQITLILKILELDLIQPSFHYYNNYTQPPQTTKHIIGCAKIIIHSVTNS